MEQTARSKARPAPRQPEVRSTPARSEVPGGVQELLRKRWSPRAFSEKPVSPEHLRSLFEAARWAPSSFNQQPWSFIVTTRDDPEPFDRLAGTLSERKRL